MLGVYGGDLHTGGDEQALDLAHRVGQPVALGSVERFQQRLGGLV